MSRDRTTPEVIVAITEAFDGANVERLGALIAAAVALRPTRLVVDLHHCPSIDAGAIVVLLQVHRQLVCADGWLTLRGPVSRVRRMLALARVDHVLDIEPAPGEAHFDGDVLAEAR